METVDATLQPAVWQWSTYMIDLKPREGPVHSLSGHRAYDTTERALLPVAPVPPKVMWDEQNASARGSASSTCDRNSKNTLGALLLMRVFSCICSSCQVQGAWRIPCNHPLALAVVSPICMGVDGGQQVQSTPGVGRQHTSWVRTAYIQCCKVSTCRLQ